MSFNFGDFNFGGLMNEEKLSQLQRIRQAAERFFVSKDKDNSPEVPTETQPLPPSEAPTGQTGKNASVGQLALDIHETAENIVVTAPIAGVRPEDLTVVIKESQLKISGERKQDDSIPAEAYLTQECYWGAFEREFVLPVPVVSEEASAQLKDGVLKITIPKLEAKKTKVIKVKSA